MMRVNPYTSALWIAAIGAAWSSAHAGMYYLLAQLLIVAAWADAGWP